MAWRAVASNPSEARQIHKTSVSITSASTEIANFVAPQVDTLTELIFRVTVDDLIDSSVDDVAVLVSPVPLPEIEVMDRTNATVTDGSSLAVSPNPDSDGTPAQEVLTIKNTGDAILTLGSVLVQSVDNLTVTNLALASTSVLPGDTTTLTITYTVTSKGAFSMDLDLLSNDLDEATYDILLQGTSNNQAPVASAGADQTVVAGSTVLLTAAASTDGDGDRLTYSWHQTAGPNVALDNPSLSNPSFTAPSVSEETQLSFQVMVFDGTTWTSDDVNIFVVVSTARSHLSTATVLSSAINKNMVRSTAGLVSTRTRSRLTTPDFEDLQSLGAPTANLDEIDTFLMAPDQAISGDNWLRFTSDDLFRDIKQQRAQRLAQTLDGIGSTYDLGFDPIDSLLGGQRSGLDTYSAFGIGRYARKDKADYEGLGGYVTLGADYLFDDTFLIGAAFTAESNTLTFDDEQNGSLQKVGSRANFYTAFYLDDFLYFEATAGTGGYNNQIEANFSKGETNSVRLEASAKIGLNYEFDRIALSPWGQVTYSKERFDAYTTSDATAIQSFDIKAGDGAFGLDLRTTQPLWGVLHPYANLGLAVDLTSSDATVLPNNVTFEPPSVEGRSTLGAHFALVSSTSSQIYADLSVDRTGDFHNANTTDLNLKLGISW